MAEVIKIQEFGNQLLVIFDDGSRKLAYPTVGNLWLISGGSITPPVGGLVDPFTPLFSITGGWEDHFDYSFGGTDWAMPEGTGLPAVASGNIVNYPNIDGAGLKSMLVFDQSYERKLPASTTLMNGSYYENPTAPAVAFMMQHLSSQLPEGHYNQNEVCAISGNTGTSTGPHLHAHLLATPTVGGDRLDFLKFV